MAITDKEKGVWGLDQVYNKINQGSIWTYEGELYSWGPGGSGQLAQNNQTQYSSPVLVSGTAGWTKIFKNYGDTTTISGLKSDGTIWTWGSGGNGQLAQNNRTQYSSPIQIPGTTWVVIRNGNGFSGGLKTDGTLWTWGGNYYGQLGHNQPSNTLLSSPVQIPGSWGTTIDSLGSGSAGMTCIKADGTLWAWGYNGYGGLGQNNKTNYSSPRQVGSATDWSSVASFHSFHNGAIKTDGTLWIWGKFDATGQNNATDYSSPIQVPGGDTTWSKISGATKRAFAIKTDGTLWSWGNNGNGGLGHNDTTNIQSPKQVPGTNWSDVVGRAYGHTLASKTDGTLWSWGNNDNGQLGHNNTTQRSSPVQIPGTDWMGSGAISMGESGSFAIKT